MIKVSKNQIKNLKEEFNKPFLTEWQDQNGNWKFYSRSYLDLENIEYAFYKKVKDNNWLYVKYKIFNKTNNRTDCFNYFRYLLLKEEQVDCILKNI